MSFLEFFVALLFGFLVGEVSGLFGIFCLLCCVLVAYELVSGMGTVRAVYLRKRKYSIPLMQIGFLLGAVHGERLQQAFELFSATIFAIAFALIVGSVVYGSKRVFPSLSGPVSDTHDG